jgi:hypothetical protein
MSQKSVVPWIYGRVKDKGRHRSGKITNPLIPATACRSQRKIDYPVLSGWPGSSTLSAFKGGHIASFTRPPSRLMRSIKRLAHTNSAANSPSPKKITSHPGPGVTSITTPARSKVKPATIRNILRTCQRCGGSCDFWRANLMAERVGFEPTVGFLLHTLSKRAP